VFEYAVAVTYVEKDVDIVFIIKINLLAEDVLF